MSLEISAETSFALDLTNGEQYGPVQLTIDYTATQFEFKFKLPSTKSITIYDGDGTTTVIPGQDAVEITHTTTYSSADTYKFWINGDVLDITHIDISGQAFVSGDVSTWSQIPELISAIFDSTGITGGSTVGSGKDYTTIAAAVAGVTAGDLISVEAGTYNEHVDLSSKLVHLIGQGNMASKLLYVAPNNTYSTITLGTDSSIRNLVINRRYFFAGVHKEMVTVTACSPTFKYVKVGVVNTGNEYDTNRPMIIQNASVVNMTDCAIWATGNQQSQLPHHLTVADTSRLYFEGTVFRARLTTTDSSYASITTDYLDTYGNINTIAMVAEDSSEQVFNVRIKERYIVQSTDIEKTGGVLFSALTFNIYDSATLTVSGEEIQGSTRIHGDNCTINFNDVTTTEGHFWIVTEPEMSSTPTSQNTVVNLDNCDIILDMDSDAVGLHIMEITKPIVVNIIDSVLEFSGHNGSWFTMGQCIQINGAKECTLTGSNFIDNCNDNIPYGVNYEQCVLIPLITTITDCIFTNQNWDSVAANNACIKFSATIGGDDININLTNVTLNSDVGTACPIQNSGGRGSYTENDYICVTNVIDNSGAAGIFGDVMSGSNSAANWAILTGQCP